MTSGRLFAISVAVRAEGDRASLMAMASVLHRRGVSVVDAEFGRPSHGRRVFSATFHAEPSQARTILRSFENLVDVLDASLFEALDTRAIHAGPSDLVPAGQKARRP